MKVSVVMSTYNGEKYIMEQLDSLRKQSKQADEVILYDDASTDNTVTVIQTYLKKYDLKSWRLYCGEENKGYISGFTQALRYATGEVIFLADQDDIWEVNKIRDMHHLMKKHSRILALNSSFTIVDEFGEKREERKVPFSSNNGWMLFKLVKKEKVAFVPEKYILKNNISPGCTMAIRRKLLADFFSFDDGEKIPHDWKLNFLAAKSNGCFFWNRSLTKYRIHQTNAIGAEVNQVLTKQYRIHTYEIRLNGYNAYSEVFFNQKEKFGYQSYLKCEQYKKFYKKRINALEEEKIGSIVCAAIYGLFVVGLEGLTTLMDIGSILRK